MVKWSLGKITEETRRPYGRLMGLGAILLSVSFMVSGALSWLLESEWPYTISAVAAFISVSIILYAQFKYNKGIF